MAITITPDIVAGTSYREDDRGGDFMRVWRVDGLESNAGITDQSLYATDGLGAVVPKAGQQHEKMPDLVLRGVEVVPVAGSKTAVRLYLKYVKVRRRLLDVRINGVSVNGATSRDRNGEIILIGYNGPTTVGGRVTAPGTPFPPKDPNDKGSSGWAYNANTRVPFPSPQTVLEIVYLEKGSPFPKIKKYTRKVNSKDWQGGKAREWFCEAILAQIESPIPLNLADLPDQQVVTGPAKFNWIVTYRFLYKEKPVTGGNNLDAEGWDPLVVFVDQNTGRPPDDINPKAGGWPAQKKGNGWYVPDIAGEADFDELKLVQCDVV